MNPQIVNIPNLILCLNVSIPKYPLKFSVKPNVHTYYLTSPLSRLFFPLSSHLNIISPSLICSPLFPLCVFPFLLLFYCSSLHLILTPCPSFLISSSTHSPLHAYKTYFASYSLLCLHRSFFSLSVFCHLPSRSPLFL